MKEWIDTTYTHPLLRDWLPVYLRRKCKGFLSMAGLPQKTRSIAEKQDAIGWTNFTEGRVTQRIRDMQTAYMCNRGVTCTVNHWMKDFIRKLLGFSHEKWLERNLMKHHITRGATTLKTEKELLSAEGD